MARSSPGAWLNLLSPPHRQKRFRHPHRRFGTTHRFINLIAGLQILTIVLTNASDAELVILPVLRHNAWDVLSLVALPPPAM